MQQVVGNMIEDPLAHSPAYRLFKRAVQNSQMAVRGSLARAQRQWKCEAVSGSHELLSGRGKSQDRGAFNALHAKNGCGAPGAAHAQQMSKQAAKRKAIRSGSLIDLLSVLGGSYCTGMNRASAISISIHSSTRNAALAVALAQHARQSEMNYSKNNLFYMFSYAILYIYIYANCNAQKTGADRSHDPRRRLYVFKIDQF